MGGFSTVKRFLKTRFVKLDSAIFLAALIMLTC